MLDTKVLILESSSSFYDYNSLQKKFQCSLPLLLQYVPLLFSMSLSFLDFPFLNFRLPIDLYINWGTQILQDLLAQSTASRTEG